MITFLFIFIILVLLLVLSFCFKLAGGILKIAAKLIVCLPCALICGLIGLVLCCTLVLIPLGVLCFKLAGFLLNPLKTCMA